MKSPFRHPTRQNGANLAADITRLLKAQPGQTADALAAQLGFGDSAVRARLLTMEEDGAATYTLKTGAARYARVKVWKLIDGAALPAPKLRKDESGMQERRISTKHYPLIDRRDPLVSALFGPAGKEAA